MTIRRISRALLSERQREPAHRAVRHRDVQPPTFSSTLDLEQRAQDRDGGLHAATADVSDLHSERSRCAIARSV